MSIIAPQDLSITGNDIRLRASDLPAIDNRASSNGVWDGVSVFTDRVGRPFTPSSVGRFIVVNNATSGGTLPGVLRIIGYVDASRVIAIDTSAGHLFSATPLNGVGYLLGPDCAPYLTGSVVLPAGNTFLVIDPGTTGSILNSLTSLSGGGTVFVALSASVANTAMPLVNAASSPTIRNINFEWADNILGNTRLLAAITVAAPTGRFEVTDCTFKIPKATTRAIASSIVNYGTVIMNRNRYIPNGDAGTVCYGMFVTTDAAAGSRFDLHENDFHGSECGYIGAIHNYARVSVQNNQFHDMIAWAPSPWKLSAWGPALEVWRATRVKIVGNNMSDTIFANSAANQSIISVAGSTNVDIRANDTRGSLRPVGSGSKDEICIEACQDFQVLNNIMGSTTPNDFHIAMTSQHDGFNTACSNGLVSGNRIALPSAAGNSFEAIVADNGTKHVVISNNVVTGWMAYGILCKTGSMHINVVDNVIRAENDTAVCVQIGETATAATGCHVGGNLFVGSAQNGGGNATYGLVVAAGAIGTQVGKNGNSQEHGTHTAYTNSGTGTAVL